MNNVSLVSQTVRNHRKSGIRIPDIVEETGLNPKQVTNSLYKLGKRGEVKAARRGVYVPGKAPKKTSKAPKAKTLLATDKDHVWNAIMVRGGSGLKTDVRHLMTDTHLSQTAICKATDALIEEGKISVVRDGVWMLKGQPTRITGLPVNITAVKIEQLEKRYSDFIEAGTEFIATTITVSGDIHSPAASAVAQAIHAATEAHLNEIAQLRSA